MGSDSDTACRLARYFQAVSWRLQGSHLSAVEFAIPQMNRTFAHPLHFVSHDVVCDVVRESSITSKCQSESDSESELAVADANLGNMLLCGVHLAFLFRASQVLEQMRVQVRIQI